MDLCNKDLILISLILVVFIFFPSSMRAQNHQPGFTSSLYWNQFVELLESQEKMTASNFALGLGFTSPQTLDIFFSLGLEELDYTNENGVKKKWLTQ